MTQNKAPRRVNLQDEQCIQKAQTRILRAYRRLGNWRAVGERFDVNHRYAWDLALNGVVPPNPDTRRKLGLPRVLPSERKVKARKVAPKVGAEDWEDAYFRKVKK